MYLKSLTLGQMTKLELSSCRLEGYEECLMLRFVPMACKARGVEL